MNKGWG
ncbi:hypothetical protein YPPY99_3207, partial [Yersinia pestis PY-99]